MTHGNDAATTPDGSEGRETVTRDMAVSPEQVFAVLADPARHHEMDAVAMVQHPLSSEPLTGVGQVFTMEMQRRINREGDTERYVMDNHVTAFDPPRRIAWEPAPHGEQAPGWSWNFDIEPTPGGCRVSQTYDWSRVTDPRVLASIPLPAIATRYREASLARLEQAAQRD